MASLNNRALASAAALTFCAAMGYGAIIIQNPSGGNPSTQPFQITATTGTPVNIQLSATPAAIYTWTITGGALAAGLTLNTSGVISGTPTTPGTYPFTIVAADPTGATGSASFNMTVQPGALTITTISPLFDAAVGQAYTDPLQAIGGVQPYTWSISTGALPAGLTINASTGLISGTPTTPGTFMFTALVKDSAATPATATQQLQILVRSPTLVITTPTLSNGSVGVPYSQPISASGGLPPYTWTVASGAVPGLSLDPNSGTYSGTPITGGTFSPKIQVTDSSGTVTSRTFSLTIAAAALTITTQSPLPGGTAGQSYTASVAAAGGVPPYSWSAVGLPTGLTIDPNSGVISGTVMAASAPNNPFNVVIRVTDSTSNSTVTGLAMAIALPPPPSVSITGVPGTSKPAQQIPVQITLAQPYSGDITGELSLSLAPTINGANDGSIQFAGGGTTATYTIPAGQTTISAPVNFQTGTLTGTITVSATALAYTQPQTVSSVPVAISGSTPVISSATLSVSGQNIAVAVAGFSPTRDMTSAAFTFSATGGSNLSSSSFTVQVGAPFGAWFKDPTINQYGSQFLYTQTFAVTGDPNSVVLQSVTLTNSQGASAAFTPGH
ncbi:MAG: putative Ig domain-containing protein [Bryobacterales bacterium]|nr:putative Ig domain-containing protein [Bryobacterales bacterium]MBV9400210.1 putative Ig domain-containing protein [Bryobacterales bacterium]